MPALLVHIFFTPFLKVIFLMELRLRYDADDAVPMFAVQRSLRSSLVLAALPFLLTDLPAVYAALRRMVSFF